MKLDERGKQCPLPVIDTKRALESCGDGQIVEILVDNEIAVQNLRKMAAHKALESSFEKTGHREFLVKIRAAGSGKQANADELNGRGREEIEEKSGKVQGKQSRTGKEPQGGTQGKQSRTGKEPWNQTDTEARETQCQPDSRRKGMVAVISSSQMGQGDEALGKLLMKGFVYALTQQDVLPETVLLYNSGAYLSCEGSENLEDLKALEAQGVEILTCGTCLNHYGLGDRLRVGDVTNMYEIVERMTASRLLVRP